MVHKIYQGVKYDSDGDLDLSSLTPKQKKFFELRDEYDFSVTDFGMFMKAFDQCWNEHGMDFTESDLDEKLEPLLDAEREKKLFQGANFND